MWYNIGMGTYTVGQFAKLLNKSIRTIQKWDSTGLLVAYRTPTNRRFYTQEQVDNYFLNAKRPYNAPEK